MNLKQSLRGFTLTELLLYIGLLLIFLTIISQLFLSALDTQLDIKSTTAFEQDELFIKKRFEYDLLHADSITTPSNIGTSGPILVLSSSGQQITYSLTGNDLIRTDTNGSYVVNSNNSLIQNLNFTHKGFATGSAALKVNYTLRSTIQSNTIDTKDINFTVGIR